MGKRISLGIFLLLFTSTSLWSWSTERALPDEEHLKRLRNGIYYPTVFDEKRSVTLTDGSYKFRNDTGTEHIQSTLIPKFAYGPLKPDSPYHYATILATSTGGSGTFVDLVVLNDHRTPYQHASVFLGDRTKINTLKIQDHTIIVNMVRHGKGYSICCPTEWVINHYKMEKDVIKLVKTEVVGNLSKKKSAVKK